MIEIITAILVFLAILFSYFGWRWESNTKRPISSYNPLVSILIPSYNSPSLEETLESVKNLDYPKKEMFIVDDSGKDLSTIAKKYNANLIQNPTRMGKSQALNKAVNQTNGEILFFVDSDTTVERDSLSKLVPWFSKEGVAAVSPKYTVKNKTNFLTRLISLEHYFISSLFKIHMYFGSLISFRGCGIAIRRSSFIETGGWPETLIEDTDFAARLVKSGKKIQYEPQAIIRTGEPETISEFKKQRLRWGKGTGFSFLNHRGLYTKNIQFSLYIFPYLLFCFAVAAFLLYQTSILLLPMASMALIYTLSVNQFASLVAIFLFPVAIQILSVTGAVTAASFTHVAIVTNSEREEMKDLVLIIPYLFFYFPMTMALYLKGIFSAARAKRRGDPQMDFTHW
jgi:cellulose synthase/poly-beta-1,6-N-acetylglucosamine synthase-like glycosyltransferase